MAAYPSSINPASSDDFSLNTSFLTAFAEEDDEDREDDERDEDEIEDEEKDDEERDDDDEKDDENELENDEERDDDDEKDDENELENDEERDDDDEKDDENELENDEEKDDEELEIEVEVKNDKAKIKIELNDDDYRFVLTDDVSESAIIAAIIDKTGLTEDEITSNWEFEIEGDEDEDHENDGDSQVTDIAKTEKLIRHEDKAQENAEDTILELQQKIDQLEQRLQKLLEKFETGEYFGKVADPDPVPDSFVITIDGFASFLDDDTVVSNLEGEIFLESLVTGSESTKLRITGGEILVGDTFYDFVIGKARLSSSGTSGEKDSMIILGQVMDDQGNVNTIRLSLDGTTSLDDFGSESVDFEINSSRSKIASQWGFDGVGLLSTL